MLSYSCDIWIVKILWLYIIFCLIQSQTSQEFALIFHDVKSRDELFGFWPRTLLVDFQRFTSFLINHNARWWNTTRINCLFCLFVCFMVFNATFSNISAISLLSVLMVEETDVPGENHRPVASHWQTLSHYVVHFTLIEIRTHNISGDKALIA